LFPLSESAKRFRFRSAEVKVKHYLAKNKNGDFLMADSV